jgi:hypothetical protein
MKTVLLDGNVYNELARDSATRAAMSDCVARGLLRVICTPTIRRELEASPFGGIPDWFPVHQELESVSILPFRLGETRLGAGDVYKAHRGSSRQRQDAEIADAANTYADVLVTQDRRCRTRTEKFATRCRPLAFAEFKAWLCILRGTAAA